MVDKNHKGTQNMYILNNCVPHVLLPGAWHHVATPVPRNSAQCHGLPKMGRGELQTATRSRSSCWSWTPTATCDH